MIRQRGKSKSGTPIWEIRIEAGRDPATGKRVPAYSHFHGTKRQAQAEERRLLHDRDQGVPVLPKATTTTGEFLEHWLNDYGTLNLSARTLQGYRDIVRLHITPTFGNVPLNKITRLSIQRLLAEKKRNGRIRGSGGLSDQTVLHIYQVIHQTFAYAISVSLLAANPCAGMKAPRVDKEEVKPLLTAELAQIAKAAQGTPLHDLTLVALVTGIEKGRTPGAHVELRGLAEREPPSGTLTLRDARRIELQEAQERQVAIHPAATRHGRPSRAPSGRAEQTQGLHVRGLPRQRPGVSC
jgi:integrase